MRSTLLQSIMTILIVSPSFAADAPQTQPAGATSLTIYSTAAPGAIPAEMYRPGPGGERPYGQPVPGYAVIKQERDIDIANPRQEVRFSDVAAQIEPTTVTFESLTNGHGTHVLDQNYQFDLVSTAKLMERYIDHEITADQVQGDKTVSVTGTLLSTQGGLVLRTQDGRVQVLTQYSNVRFPELPGGLITRPTLVWDLETDKPGKHRTRVTYQTGGMTWWADYNVVFSEGENANSGVLDLGAWVSIINQSGASYPDAKLKLIAGDVHRAPQPRPGYGMGGAKAARMLQAEAAPGFEEKAFFEYHLYTLGRPATLPDNSTKQIELFPTARGVPAEKVLVYYGLQGFQWFAPDPAIDRNLGTQANKKVDIYLRFKNEKAIGLGMPLPSGRIRVSKMDPADKSLEFIGEDTIDHTAKDEQVLIKLGSAFDVVGERRQVNFGIDVSRRVMDEDIEIKLRNHKDQPVKVLVKENLYRWTNWEITQKSHDFEKLDARTVQFPVTVPKDSEATVTYKVHYTW